MKSDARIPWSGQYCIAWDGNPYTLEMFQDFYTDPDFALAIWDVAPTFQPEEKRLGWDNRLHTYADFQAYYGQSWRTFELWTMAPTASKCCVCKVLQHQNLLEECDQCDELACASTCVAMLAEPKRQSCLKCAGTDSDFEDAPGCFLHWPQRHV